ncbi:MAG: sodium/glutamate symporter [Treponemataceae bacterium]
MMSFSFDMVQTLGCGVVLLLLGRAIKERVKFFETYCIPAPVIGGFLFAIVHLILRQANVLAFEFNETLRVFFMNMFFATIGFNASLRILKKGGFMVLKFLFVSIVLAVLQNAIAVLLAPLVGVHPILALMTGSTPMTGGHGTSGGIASSVEAMGFNGATAVAFTAATFGLVAGSLMGGPIGRFLITKNKLESQDIEEKDEKKLSIKKLDENIIMNAFFHILVALFLGTYVTQALNWGFAQLGAKICFPSYLGAMLIGAIMRNVFDDSKLAPPNGRSENCW